MQSQFNKELSMMKHIFIFLLICGATLASAAQEKAPKAPVADKPKDTLLVDAACGQCRFDLKGTGCDLAVRINGKAYFVDGTHIDEHGDAHAEDGFCNAIRKAKVQGNLVGDRFKASYFKLADSSAKKEKHQ